MISSIQPSLVAFYGGTVVAVIALFSVATRFGETHLNAPPRIDGLYPITATNLPGCLDSQPVVLRISQSGIFVNGALLPAQASEEVMQAAAKRPPLTGRFDHQAVWLTGTLPQFSGCQAANDAVGSAIEVQGKIQGTTLTGALQLKEPPTRVSFTAEREDLAETRSTH